MPEFRIRLSVVALLLSASAAHAQGDPQAGARDFQTCAACHSLQAGRHMTGPSLSGILDRKAATLADFPRYSPALKRAGITWDDKTLDRWLANPQAVVPGTYMVFPGIKDEQARADLIAYLKSATADTPPRSPQGGGMTMGGQGGGPTDLKTLGPDAQLASIRYCGDTYVVTSVSGKTQPMWENNLRFKTDSSNKGPRKGHPVLLPTGMMGDRASAVFADPAEIGTFIERKC